MSDIPIQRLALHAHTHTFNSIYAVRMISCIIFSLLKLQRLVHIQIVSLQLSVFSISNTHTQDTDQFDIVLDTEWILSMLLPPHFIYHIEIGLETKMCAELISMTEENLN